MSISNIFKGLKIIQQFFFYSNVGHFVLCGWCGGKYYCELKTRDTDKKRTEDLKKVGVWGATFPFNKEAIPEQKLLLPGYYHFQKKIMIW